MNMELLTRYASRIEKPDSNGCMNWNGARSGNYGSITYQSKSELAHRVIYMIHHGPIPEGKVVLHKCDNGFCVNLEHLLLGTQGDNIDDMINKGRAKFGTKQLGSKNGFARLDEDQVREIKALLAEGKMFHWQIADKYGVVRSTIGQIKNGQIWRHV